MAITPNMSLTTWPNVNDVFDHTALAGNFTAIDQHDHTSGKGVPVGVGGIASLAVGTAQLQDSSAITSKLADASVTAPKLGAAAVTGAKLDPVTVGMRGKSNISAPGVRSNIAYGALDNGPDQVTGIVLPTDGLIAVFYQAMWQESVQNNARAAIFVGANQLQTQDTGTGGPGSQAAVMNSGATVNKDRPLFSHGAGLASAGATASNAFNFFADVTTGQVVGGAQGASSDTNGAITTSTPNVGGPCYIFAAAGTYTVSVQFKAFAGSVTVKNRRLWVFTMGF